MRRIRQRIDSFSVRHILSWLPGSFTRNAKVVRRHVEEYRDISYNAITSAMVRTTTCRTCSDIQARMGYRQRERENRAYTARSWNNMEETRPQPRPMTSKV